jgi:DNA-binding PadR family transcriptional regulator
VTRERRPSPQTVAVLLALAVAPQRWRYGYELGAEVGLKAGSLYPILIRLTDRGLLEAEWEPDPAPGRPARHLYRLTPAGVAAAAEVASATAEVAPGVGTAPSVTSFRPGHVSVPRVRPGLSAGPRWETTS